MKALIILMALLPLYSFAQSQNISEEFPESFSQYIKTNSSAGHLTIDQEILAFKSVMDLLNKSRAFYKIGQTETSLLLTKEGLKYFSYRGDLVGSASFYLTQYIESIEDSLKQDSLDCTILKKRLVFLETNFPDKALVSGLKGHRCYKTLELDQLISKVPQAKSLKRNKIAPIKINKKDLLISNLTLIGKISLSIHKIRNNEFYTVMAPRENLWDLDEFCSSLYQNHHFESYNSAPKVFCGNEATSRRIPRGLLAKNWNYTSLEFPKESVGIDTEGSDLFSNYIVKKTPWLLTITTKKGTFNKTIWLEMSSSLNFLSWIALGPFLHSNDDLDAEFMGADWQSPFKDNQHINFRSGRKIKFSEQISNLITEDSFVSLELQRDLLLK